MSEVFDEQTPQTLRHVRLDTLVRLRWLAVLGQTAAVLVEYFGHGRAGYQESVIRHQVESRADLLTRPPTADYSPGCQHPAANDQACQGGFQPQNDDSS